MMTKLNLESFNKISDLFASLSVFGNVSFSLMKIRPASQPRMRKQASSLAPAFLEIYSPNDKQSSPTSLSLRSDLFSSPRFSIIDQTWSLAPYFWKFTNSNKLVIEKLHRLQRLCSYRVNVQAKGAQWTHFRYDKVIQLLTLTQF